MMENEERGFGHSSAVLDLLQNIQVECLRTTSYKQESLVTGLEKLHKAVQNWLRTESLPECEVKPLCEGLCTIFCTVCLHYKLGRKLAKIFVCLESHYPDTVKVSLQECCSWQSNESGLNNQKKMAIWSQLLEISAVSRDLVKEDFSGFVTVLTTYISDIWSSEGGHWSKDRQEQLQLSVKVSLQLTQHLSGSVCEAVWLSSIPLPSIVRLFEVLLCVVDTEIVYDDTRRLAATVFGYVVQLGADNQSRTEAFQHLHSNDSSRKFSLGMLQLERIKSDQASSSVYGSLCFIQGFLACCPASQLSYGPVCNSQGGEQQPTLAIYILTTICRICDNSQHVYQAIKTLLLWYQKVHKWPACLGRDRLLNESHPVVALTLPLVWNNLESPVEGVSELGLALFQALVSLLMRSTGQKQPEKEQVESKPLGEQCLNQDKEIKTEGGIRNEGGAKHGGGAKNEGGTTIKGRAENEGGAKNEGGATIKGVAENNGKAKNTGEITCNAQVSDDSEEVDGVGKKTGVRPEGGGDSSGLVQHLLDRVMQLSWQVKGKHLLCAVLLPHVHVDKFLEHHSDTWEQLLHCMCTNYLASPATQMYKVLCSAILNRFQTLETLPALTNVYQYSHMYKEKSHTEWKLKCLPQLITGITSKHSLMCYNVCHLWLPWTLSTVSDSYKILLNQLKADTIPGCTNEQLLRARVSVCMATRRLQIAGITDLPHKMIVEALLHPSDDVRLDAFAFVCNSPKTSEEFSTTEIDLLKCSLPYAMTSDSPPFRPQLQAHIRALVTRVRDNVLASLRELDMTKKKKKAGKDGEKSKEEGLKQSMESQIDLVDWLWCLCVEHLHPGSNFQRLKTCLEWMWVILDTLVYVPGKRRRKGVCPESGQKALQYAVGQGKWQLFTYEVTRSLLACVTDGTDDIRDTGCNILLEFFPHPLPLMLAPPSPQCCGPLVRGLVQSALSLCAQPRSHDGHGGALICKLICQIYASGQGCEFTRDKNGVVVSSHSDPVSPSTAVAALIKLLVKHLQQSLDTARQNLLESARNVPTHGFIVAATYCVSDLSHVQPETIRPVLQSLVCVTQNLVDNSLDILGGRLQQDGSVPSFEQMGVSIKQVIQESQGQLSEEEVTLSTEHQLLMTWAWLNIKETSVLYSKLSELPVFTDHSPGVLSVDQVRDLGQTIIKILTRCIHRGAIEGSSEALCIYCTTILQSADPDLSSVPGNMLEAVLSQVLSVTDMSASSVTRRSAGLPLIVRAVLISENKSKRSILLKKTMNQLLAAAESQVPTETDQRLDLPQVHALNILKVLFAEASLAGTIMPFTERACVLAVEGFSAPLWALRNSAMQLFSTVVNRMLGPKKTKEDALHMSTTTEFFSHFPTLRGFLLSQLQRAAHQHTATSAENIDPSLFPVLAILCKLSAGVTITDADSMSGYLEAVLSLLGSPVYAMRERAAQAVVSLIPPQTVDQFLLEQSLDLALKIEDCGSFNRTHGQLLCLSAVLRSMDRNRSEEGNLLSHLQQVLDERAWLGGGSNPCALVRAAYFTLSLQVNPLLVIDEVAKELLHTEASVPQVGFPQLLQVVFNHWLTDDRQLPLEDKLSLSLGSHNLDIRCLCVKFVHGKARKGEFPPEKALEFQKLLLEMISPDSCPWQLLCQCLETLVTLFRAAGDISLDDLHLRRKWEKQLRSLILERGDCRPAALAMTVMSMFVDTEDTCGAGVTDWLYVLQRGCRPSNGEDMRLNTARSLHIAALPLVQNILQEDFINTSQDNTNVRILQTTLTLLLDENSDVRRVAAAFVSQLPGIPTCCLHGNNDIHPSYALRLLFECVMCELCQSPVAMRDVLSWMNLETQIGDVLDAERLGKVLFESQDLNPYRENPAFMAHVSSFLQSHKDNVPQSCLKLWRKELIEQLEVCSNGLTLQCTGVLNLSRKQQLYNSVSGLLHRLHTYLTITGDYKDFTDHLKSLSQIELLHPSLQRQISCIRSSLRTN